MKDPKKNDQTVYRPAFVMIGGPDDSIVPGETADCVLGDDPHTYGQRSLATGLSWAIGDGRNPVKVMKLAPLDQADVISLILGWVIASGENESDTVMPDYPQMLVHLGFEQLLGLEPTLSEPLMNGIQALWEEIGELLKAADCSWGQFDFTDLGTFGNITDGEVQAAFKRLTGLDSDAVQKNSLLYVGLAPVAMTLRLRAYLVGPKCLNVEA